MMGLKNIDKGTLFVPVICARGGSSLKDKNLMIETVSGLPLVALAVKKCLRAYATRTDVPAPVILTDSERIADVAVKAGAQFPGLFEEKDPMADVTLKLREFAERCQLWNSWILEVHCTSPGLSVETLELVPQVFLRREFLMPTNAVWVSVVREKPKFTGLFMMDENGIIEPAVTRFGWISPSVPRQKLPPAWRYTGALTLFHGFQLEKETMFDSADFHMLLHVHGAEESADIDTAEDAAKAGLKAA